MPKEQIFDKKDIDPNIGVSDSKLDIPVEFKSPEEDNIPIEFLSEPEQDITATQVGAYGVGDYFRDEEVDFQEVIDNPNELNHQRADAQSGWELLGKSLAQAGIEATLGAAEGIAYALDFEEIYNHDKQAQEGFDNWAAKGIRDFKEGLQEDYFKIYQTENAEQGSLWNKMGDGTWWASQGKTMGTTLSLMFPALGVARIAGTLGKGMRIANAATKAAVQAGLEGTAAALFSRKAESAMEANQKWQEESNNPEAKAKIEKEVLSEMKGSVDSLLKEYQDLSKVLYNPALENYQQLEFSKNEKLAGIKNQLNLLKETSSAEVDKRMKVRAGEIASKVFKANAAMLPIDALQYALLLKPLSGLKKASDAFSKSVIGKTAGTLAIQPGSEAAEEGYQFMVGGEAVASVDKGVDMFGEGFGDRFSEYVKDPHFHEAIFLGGAMGLVFDGAGPIAKKTAEKTSKFANALNSKRVSSDPNKIAKIVKEGTGSVVSRALINDNIDRNKKELEGFLSDLEDKEEYSTEEKDEIRNNYEKLIEDYDFVQKEESELMKHDSFKDNQQLRNGYTLAKLAGKHVNEDIEKYNSEYSNEYDNINIPELTANPANVGEDLNSLSKELIDAKVYLNSLTKAVKTSNNSLQKELTKNQKKSVDAYLKNEIDKANTVVEEKTKELKSKTTNFSEEKLATANIEKLQEAKDYLTESQIKNQFITSPTIASYQNLTKETAEVKEEKILKDIATEANKTIESEIRDKLRRDLPVEYYEELSNQIKDSKQVSSKTKSSIKNKIKDLNIKNQVTTIKKNQVENTKEEFTLVNEGKSEDIGSKKQGISEELEIEAAEQEPVSEVDLTNAVEGETVDFNFEEESKVDSEQSAEIVVDTHEAKVEIEEAELNLQPLPEEQFEEADEDQTEPSDDSKSFGTSRTKNFETDENGKKTDAYDENGNLIITNNALLESAIPGKFAKNTPIVLSIDDRYLDGNNNEKNLPIAIQTLEDYNNGKEPTLWVKDKKATKSDKAIRKAIFDQVNKTKKPDFKVALRTTVNNHYPAWTNKTKLAKPLTEQGIDGVNNNAQIAVANFHKEVKTRDNNGDSIVSETPSKIFSGIAYVMIKNSDEKWYPHRIAQKPVSDEKFKDIKNIWIYNAFSMIMDYANGNETFESLDHLRYEVGKYLNLNPSASENVTKIPLAKNEGEFNNFFGIRTDVNGDIVLQLPGMFKDGVAWPYQQYLITNNNGKLKIGKFVGDGNYNELQKDELLVDFATKLQNMYPNIQDIQDPELRENFTRFEANNNGELSETEPQHYYEFLSVNKIAETRVHGLKTPSGETVFSSQPSVEINNNIDSYVPVDEVATKEEVENINKENDDYSVELPVDPSETGFEINNDYDWDGLNFEEGDDFLPQNLIDFNKVKLSSFAANNDITRTLLSNVLHQLDIQKQKTGSNNLDLSIATVQAQLTALRDKLRNFSDKNLTNEEANKNGVRPNSKHNRILAERLTSVLENFKEQIDENDGSGFVGYENLIRLKFDELKFNALVEIDDEFEEASNNEGEAENKESFAANKSFKLDPEASMSARIRRLFYNVPVRASNGKIQINSIGQSKYMDSGSVFNYLIDQLVGVDANSIMDELRTLAEDNYIAKDVLTKLDNINQTNPDVIKSFISIMRKQEANFMTLKYKFSTEAKTLPTIQIIHTNRSGVTDLIEVEWNERFVADLNATDNVTIDGNTFEIKKSKSEELVEQFNSIESKNMKEDFVKSMESIGIIFSEKAYDRLLKDFDLKSKSFTKRFGATAQTKGFINFLNKAFGPIFNTAIASGENPFTEQVVAIKNLAFYQAKFEQDATSRMFKNAKGDNIYGYVPPSHLSNTLTELINNPTKVAELMSESFASKSTLLQDISEYHRLNELNELTANEQVDLDELSAKIKNVSLSYFDAAKNDVKGSKVRSYEDQSVAEKELTKLSLFINNGGNTALTFTPTASDKTTFSLFQNSRINTRSIKYKDGNFFTTKIDKHKKEYAPIWRKLKDLIVQSEIDRINHVSKKFQEAVEKDNFSNLIEGYHYITTDKGRVPGSGTYFFFLPELNKIVNENDIRNMETGELSPDFNDSKLLRQTLMKNIQEMVETKLEQWEAFGITEKGKYKSIDKSVQNAYGEPANLAVSYVINSMTNLANEFMLVTGDPSKFGKVKRFNGDYTNYKHILEGTHSNMFKRIAKDIAPGSEAEWSEKEYRLLMLNDPKAVGELAKYNDKLKKAFSKIELADAQEWTTLEEHLNVLMAYGKITKEQYDDSLKNQDNLSLAQLSTILQPMKPVQVYNKFEEDLGETVPYYIKTSSFPLIKQITKQFPQLDRMREIMETNHIQRMMPKSAIKTGFRNAIDIEKFTDFKEDGITLKDDKKVITLDRDGFRIQQDVPHSLSKEKDLEGSQLRKLITANLLSEAGVALEFDLNGETKTGKELKELNDALHVELYRRRFDDLLEEVDAVETKDGIVLNDVNNLREIMIQEATRQNYGYNEILALKTLNLNDKTIFDIPLYFHPMAHKIEALLTALIKNRVLTNKLPGKSYVQGSSFGFKAISSDFFKEFGKNEGMVFSKDYDPEKGLHYKKNNDGSIDAQIFLPMPFKKDGSPISLKEYTKDGYIDSSKLSPEMLDMIGYRIPTQKYSSMIRIKVVGFLPEASGDLIIIPPEMSAQMGSDFDVDKLKLHWYNYKINENNVITKVKYGNEGVKTLDEKQIQNKIIDIAHSVLKNEEISNQTVTLLDNTDIADVIKVDRSKNELSEAIIEAIKTNDFSELTATQLNSLSIADVKQIKASNKQMGLSVLNDNMHSEMVDIQAAGKAGVGIESVASTMHILGQYAGLYISGNSTRNTSVLFSNKKSNISEFNDFDSITKKDENGNLIVTKNPQSNTIDESINYDYPSEDGAWRLDKIFGFSGKMISDVLANIQTESVDNANNRLLHPMNLNSNTFDVANLIARTGFDEKFIGFFLNQPIILQYVEELNKLSRYDEKDFTPFAKEQLQLQMLSKVGIDIEFGQLNDISTENVSIEEMLEGMSTNGLDKAIQAKILMNFMVYDTVSKDLSTVQRTANVDTKYLGSNLNGVAAKLNNFHKDLSSDFIGNGDKLHDGPIDETTQGAAFTLGIIKSLKLYQNILPVNSNLINAMTSGFKDSVDRELRESELLDFNIAIRSSIYNEAIKTVFDIKDIEKYRTSLLHGNNALGNRVTKYKKNNKAPLFIKSLNVNNAVKKGDPILISHVSSKNNKNELDMQKSLDWLKMLESDKNSEEYKLAFDLMIYSITFGTERSANDFGRFLPSDFIIDSGLSAYLRSIDFSNTIGGQINADLIDNFIVQFVQHNPKYAKSVELDQLTVDKNGEFADLNEKNKVAPYLIRTFNSDTFETTIYKKQKGFRYRKIDKLGIEGLSQYNISTKYGKVKDTVINENQNNVEKTYLPEDDAKKIFNKFGFDAGIETLLENLTNKASSSSNKALAAFFLENANLINEFRIEKLDKSNPKYDSLSESKGFVKYYDNLIVINPNGIENQKDFEHTVLHELTHAFTVTMAKNRHLLTEDQQKLFRELDTMVEFARKQKDKNGNLMISNANFAYRTSNVGEFIAAIMTNEEFQIQTNEMNYKKTNVFQKFIDLIKSLFVGNIKSNSVLDNAMHNIVKIVKSTSTGQIEQVRLEANITDVTTYDLKEAEDLMKKCKGLVGNIKKPKFGR